MVGLNGESNSLKNKGLHRVYSVTVQDTTQRLSENVNSRHLVQAGNLPRRKVLAL